jgi:hypothetical protein
MTPPPRHLGGRSTAGHADAAARGTGLREMVTGAENRGVQIRIESERIFVQDNF